MELWTKIEHRGAREWDKRAFESATGGKIKDFTRFRRPTLSELVLEELKRTQERSQRWIVFSKEEERAMERFYSRFHLPLPPGKAAEMFVYRVVADVRSTANWSGSFIPTRVHERSVAELYGYGYFCDPEVHLAIRID